MVPLLFGGEHLSLHPTRAAVWPARRAVLVADVHLGKAATLRHHGVPVPAGTTTTDLARLGALLDETAPRTLIVLGDLFHARAGRQAETSRVAREFFAARPDLECVLVRGNHDRGAGDPPAAWGWRCVDEPLALDGLDLCHYPPDEGDDAGRPVLAGHLHPKVRLTGRGQQQVDLPCFWRRGRALVLPAFTHFAAGGLVRPGPKDGVWVVAGDEVLAV